MTLPGAALTDTGGNVESSLKLIATLLPDTTEVVLVARRLRYR